MVPVQEPECVVVLGTAHISTQSAQDVYKAICQLRPDSIVVELCASRAAIVAEEPCFELSPGPSSQLPLPAGQAEVAAEGQRRPMQSGKSGNLFSLR